MGFMDKAKAAAEQAAEKAKGGIQEVQAKRGAGQAYSELGEVAFRLADSGAISHPDLEPHVERIRALKSEEAAATVGSPPAGGDPGAAPPAMPTNY